MPAFAYHRPESVDEAVGLLAEFGGDAKVLAGGQSLLPVLALRLSHPANLVDIGRIADLARIHVQPDGAVTIGAAVTHAVAEESALVASAVPLVSMAMPFVGHRAIRSRGTVCGSLAHADPAAELPAVVLATEATLHATGPLGERMIAASDFFEGYLSTALADDELLTAVAFPATPRGAVGWSVQEVSRRHGDFALVGLAAAVTLDEDGRIQRAALAFFGAANVPTRIADAEEALVGREPTADAIAEAARIVTARLHPPDDDHASGPYRAHVAGVLTRRCVAEAVGVVAR
jgi:carbon-monoxide dehydrogenase medium subunit